MNEKSFELNSYLSHLRDTLSKISFWQAVAFSTSLCERLSSFYRVSSAYLPKEAVDIFDQSIAMLWKTAIDKNINSEKLKELKEAVSEMDLDDEEIPYYDEIIDFADSLYSCLSGVIENSVSDLAISSYKTIDSLIFRYVDNKMSENNSEFDWDIFENHFLVDKEKELHKIVLEYILNKEQLTPNDVQNIRQIVNNPESDLINLFKF